MTEMVSPYNTTLSLPWVTGAWDFSTVAGLAKVAKEITRQAAMIGYLNAFMMYAAVSAVGLVLVLVVRRRKSTLARA
jgi:DHA2 family multidrug resistance protein